MLHPPLLIFVVQDLWQQLTIPLGTTTEHIQLEIPFLDPYHGISLMGHEWSTSLDSDHKPRKGTHVSA